MLFFVGGKGTLINEVGGKGMMGWLVGWCEEVQFIWLHLRRASGACVGNEFVGFFVSRLSRQDGYYTPTGRRGASERNTGMMKHWARGGKKCDGRRDCGRWARFSLDCMLFEKSFSQNNSGFLASRIDLPFPSSFSG